ncbi:reverse transcriptase [Apostichopus japonicus]|uniref:Reverse transcriptase n=1 Tax=Stichopus japonicus TaxID=307972 RepID=A0A2G8K736_STIJA|nr:reverse transcriptase [Apostichopus japonicus]
MVDEVKLRIKHYAIQYCVTRARRRREKFSKLCAEVKFGDPLAVIALQTYLDEKYHGARVRARVEAVEAEERPSLRFYQSVSSSAGDRRVPSVRATDGTVTCAVKGHCIQQNLWLMRDLTDFVIERDLPCALVSLDQQKTFDMVDRGFLMNVLETFQLHPNFRKWISVLYEQSFSSVIVNGESLSRLLERDSKLVPFVVPGGAKVKCAQYADDVTCIVSSLGSFRALSQDLSIFERATGAKLNPEKTKGLRLGSWRYRNLPFGASWSDQNIKINGIWFGYDAPCDVTWNERAEVFQSRLETFSTRWLSILGKVTVINRFVSPILWYPGAVYPIPRRVLVRLERAIFSFIWSGGTELVKRAVLYQKLEKGGLGVVHLGSKLTFLLFKQLFVAVTDPGLPCSYFVRFWGGLHLRRWVPALFSNREPHSSTPNRVVRVICSALIELPPVDLSQPALVHSSLRDKALNATFVQGRHSAEVWRSVHSKLNGYRLRDLAWRVAHGALVTNLKRYHWRLGDGLCPRTGCDSLESTAHVFWHCYFVVNLWEWFQTWTDRVTGDRSWSVGQGFILYGVDPPVCSVAVLHRIIFVCSIVKKHVWRIGVIWFLGEICQLAGSPGVGEVRHSPSD